MTSVNAVEKILRSEAEDRQRVSELHQLLSRTRKAQRLQWQELRQNANRAIEQRNEVALASQVSFLWGFLLGLDPTNNELIEQSRRFMRQSQFTLPRLVSELARLDDLFKQL